MRVTIKSIAGADSAMIVDFVCQHGRGRGSWTTGVPRLDHEYVVELGFNQPLRIGVNTSVINNEAPLIRMSKHQTILVARIEDVFDDHVVSLRLGDSLIFGEYEGVFPGIGAYVEVTLSQIELYDAGV